MRFDQNADNIVVMEAEHGLLTAGDAFRWREYSETDAGNGKAIQPTGETWHKSLAGRAEWRVKINTAGFYNIFARVNTRGREGKIWVELDGQLHAVGPNDNGRLYYSASGFSWQNGYDNALVYLRRGIHVLKIRSLLKAVRLDRLAIVPEGSTALQVGYTGVGPAETAVGRAPANTDKYNYAAWLGDVSRDHKRVLLIELGHAGGALRLGSSLYHSESGQSFAPWIIGEPSMEYSLTELREGIGAITATLPVDAEGDWANKVWRGYRARFLYGDADWPLAKFREFGGATIEGRFDAGTRKHRFDLVSDIEKYEKTFYTGSTTRTESARLAIQWLCGQGGFGDPVFINKDNGELDVIVTYDVDENSTVYNVAKLIVNTVESHLSVNSQNVLEAMKPNVNGEPAQTITAGSIEDETVREVDVIPAYSRIRVECPAGSATKNTNADTGEYDEELTITTAHAVLSDAQAFANRMAVKHSKAIRTYTMKIFYLSSLAREGDYVAIDHQNLQGAGVIKSFRPAFVSARGTIEVQI